MLPLRSRNLVFVVSNRSGVELIRRYKFIVPFLDNFYFVSPYRQLKQCYNTFFHELRGNSSASHSRKSLFNEADVLRRLDNSDLIFTTLRLYRNDIMTSPFIQSDVEFIDLDLTDVLDCGSEMILKAVGREPQERVDQAVVTNYREQRLFVI